ncbi:MAG: TetR/AcrR family transcriptional regulator [Pygmaiobacter sp.]|nr:TetR/AcrR family transcriptional regulator [Pygmaiobacter sp.]
MSGRLEQKKQAKKQNLLDAAYSLFTQKGVAKTSVDEIVQHAQVAKGTFYLYFKDKGDVLQELIYKISYRVLIESYAEVQTKRTGDFTEDFILLVDGIVEYFSHNRLPLRLIERNFSWPMVAQQIYERADDPLWRQITQDLASSPLAQRYTQEEIFRLIYVILEMCGSTCYSSIIEHRPAPMDQMKPMLYDIIRKILQ